MKRFQGELLTVQNPFNFPLYRKSILLATACLIAFSTALNCTSVAITATWGTEWFGVDRIAFIASQTIMLSSIAVTPMILAPASEVVSYVALLGFLSTNDSLAGMGFTKSPPSCSSDNTSCCFN